MTNPKWQPGALQARDTTREFVTNEFAKAHRDTREHSTLVLTPSGGAGWLLRDAQGSVQAAIGLALANGEEFWAVKVRMVLEAIKKEEESL